MDHSPFDPPLTAPRRWLLMLAATAGVLIATGCAVNPVPTPGKALDTKGNDATAGGVGTDQADAAFAEGDAASLASDATEAQADAGAVDGSCGEAGQDGVAADGCID